MGCEEGGGWAIASHARQENFSHTCWITFHWCGISSSVSVTSSPSFCKAPPQHGPATADGYASGPIGEGGGALRLTIDPVHRENLTNIREFWISLANEQPCLSEHEFAKEAEAIGRFHANL